MEKDTLAEIKKELGDVNKWMKNHETEDAKVRAKVDSMPTREDIEETFRKILKEFFLGAGKWSKATLVTLALVVGSITVIFGGLKALLGWIGFVQLK